MNGISPWRIRRMAGSETVQSDYTYVPPADEVQLREYWNILVTRRWTVIALFLIVSAVGAYFPFTATKLYTASATIKIEPRDPLVTGLGTFQADISMGSTSAGTYDYYQTQFALLRSRPLAARVISDLKLDSNDNFKAREITSPAPWDRVGPWLSGRLGHLSRYVASIFQTEVQTGPSQIKPSAPNGSQGKAEIEASPSLINRYQRFLEVVPVEKTRLVQVRFTTPDPALSQVLANAHVQSFLRMSLENRFSLTEDAREFLQQKRSELKEKLAQSEGALNNFRRRHGVVSVEKGENIVVDRLMDLNRQLTIARAQRIEAESLHRTVENKGNQDLAEVMKQGLVQQLKGTVAGLESERVRLAAVFKPEHPRIQELNQQLAAARDALSNEIAHVVRGIQSSYSAAVVKERSLQAEADKQQQDALKLKEVGVDYTLLQQEVSANQSLYESVFKRLSETNVSNDIALSNIQIAERADKPQAASLPKTSLYLVASIISGLFFGVGVAFAQEYVTSVMTSADDVYRALGLGTLGFVPHFKLLKSPAAKRITRGAGDSPTRHELTSNRLPSPALIINQDPISVVAESYRTIRTSLLLSQAEKAPQVILFTSPAPGEGKTTTALNLSIALANDDHSVLVIDGDMRRGCCHSRLGLGNNRGLSNVLTGGLSLEEGIQRTCVTGLSLLSRGVLPPNPTELLGSRRMREILQELRRSFEFILIDSSPVIALSDAAVLSVLSDGVLLVINGQTTSTQAAQKAVERLDMVRASLLGVILNGVNLTNPSYSYYRAHSSYYVYKPSEDEGVDQSNWNGLKRLFNVAHLLKAKPEVQNNHTGETTLNNVNPAPAPESKAPEGAFGAAICEAVRETNTAPIQIGDGGRQQINSDLRLLPVDTGSTRATEDTSSTDTARVAVVSEDSWDRLIAALTCAMGPIAALVLREQVATLGEIRTAFPKTRVGELLKLIQLEITPEELMRFEAAIPEEFRDLAKNYPDGRSKTPSQKTPTASKLLSRFKHKSQ